MRSFKCVIIGLGVLCNYYDDDSVNGEYDSIVVYKNKNVKISDSDRDILLRLGWSEDEESWYI